MKSILVQQIYPNKGNFIALIQETMIRNVEYCKRFDMDYAFIASEIFDISNGGWDKLLHVQRFFDYDFVVWLDSDALIFDTSRDLRTVPTPGDSIGVVRFLLPVPHFNVGVMYFRVGPRVKSFVKEWLKNYPGEGAWHEQAVFNKIKNECVVEIPKEWNRNYDNNPHASPVIVAFHGFGSAEKRLALMQRVLGNEFNAERASLGRHA